MKTPLIQLAVIVVQKGTSYVQEIQVRSNSYTHSDITWNQVLANLEALNVQFLTILDAQNFDFGTFYPIELHKFTKNHNSDPLKFAK